MRDGRPTGPDGTTPATSWWLLLRRFWAHQGDGRMRLIVARLRIGHIGRGGWSSPGRSGGGRLVLSADALPPAFFRLGAWWETLFGLCGLNLGLRSPRRGCGGTGY